MTRRPLSPQDQHEVAELTSQVEGLPRLKPAQVEALLDEVRAHRESPARERLVENFLHIALAEARRRADRGVDIGDLFQEATLAVMVALHEFASRDGAASRLDGFTKRVVVAHLDATLEAAEIDQRGEEAFVRDAQLYEAAELTLRRRLGRAATPTEIASLLEWPPERVETMAGMLGAARQLYDSDIALYLDEY